MKKKIVVLAFALLGIGVYAQVNTPSTSTKAEVRQVVGLTDVNIDYSRPNMRGRQVYGDLVPYGRLWRTGANMNTVVTFGNDVEIDGKKLKKGSYALFTIPKIGEWEVIFYSDTDNWGLPENWDDDKVTLSTKVEVLNTNRTNETFTIGINNVNIDYADLEIIWEKTIVPVRFKVPTDQLAMESIEKTFDGSLDDSTEGPTIVDYYAAAEYYYLTDKDMKPALQWIDNAIEKSGDKIPYYFVRLKSQIQAKSGDKSAAVETAKKALELAEKANNQDYVKINQDAIKEWSK